MIRLNERLQLISELVNEGASVCDIGCDHGYLAIYLLSSGRARSVIASDVRPLPLDSARKNAARYFVEPDFRLCDGLSEIKKGEADTVIIAGMGGEVMANILSKCDWIKNNRIVLLLQPMTSAELLRDFLAENGFYIDAEPAVSENGKVYSVIKAHYTGKVYRLSEAERYIGKVLPDSACGKAYIEKQCKRLEACISELRNIPEKKKEFIKLESTVFEIKRFLEGYYAV